MDMNTETTIVDSLKEEVEQHFAGVKSMEEWNKRRQDLCDDWSTRFTDDVTVISNGIELTIPAWVQLIVRYVDASGLSVQTLGKNHKDVVIEEK
jgi:hypothetical protein